MKITTRQYARLLMDLQTEAPAGVLERRVVSFLAFLKKRRAMRRLPRIIAAYSQLRDREQNIRRVHATFAHEPSDKLLRALKTVLSDRFPKNELLLETTIDDSLLGGVTLRFDDTRLDLSLARRIQSITR